MTARPRRLPLPAFFRPPAGLLAALTLAVALGLTALAAGALADREASLQARIERDLADTLAREADLAFQRYGDFLAAAAGFFDASEEVLHGEWQAFVTRAWRSDAAGADLAAVAYLERVEPAARVAWEARIGQQNRVAARIRPVGPLGQLGGAHFPVAHIEPDSARGRAFLGSDLATDAQRRALIDEAARSGRMRLSPPLNLFLDATAGPGAILALAVYRPGTGPGAPEHLGAGLRGLVLLGFHYQQWLTALQPVLGDTIGLRLEDAASGVLLAELGPAGAQPALARDLELGGQHLRLLVRPAGGGAGGSLAALVWGAGTAIGLVLALAVFQLLRRDAAAQDLARRMTADLRDGERRFALAAEAADEGIWEWRPGHPPYLSERCAQLLGVPAQAGWRQVLRSLPRDARHALLRALRAHLRRQDAVDVELTLPRPEGGPHRLRLRARAEWGSGGAPGAVDADRSRRLLRMAGAVSDVTVLRDRELNLARTRNFLSRLIELLPIPVMLKGADGRYELLNRAAAELYGLPPEDIVGRRSGDFMGALIAARHEADDRWVLATGSSLSREESWNTPDGRPGTLIVRKTRVEDGEGRPAVIVVLLDITSLREAEASLRRHRDDLSRLVEEQTRDLVRARDAAEAANAAKSRFLANMSHELRTPLHAVLSYARLGEERVGQAEVARLRDYFERIHVSGQRLLDLLNNLLDLARLEAGAMPVDARPTDLAALVRDAAREFGAYFQSRRLNLVLRLEAGVPRSRVDPARIGQILRNLLSNAGKFTPAGGEVVVELDGEAPASDSPLAGVAWVCLRVLDSGVGIPPEELESIFEKFTQSSRTRSGAGGTGLGLAICREIAEAHGGQIRATNRIEGGALFELRLPVAGPPARHGENGGKGDAHA